MVDKIEMSLDDIIKANKNIGSRKVGRGGLTQRRRGGAGGGRVTGRSPRVQRKPGGGILKGGNRGGITRAKYARGDVNSAWKHDMYDGPKRGLGGGIKIVTGGKLLVSNLDYGVSESDIHELFTEFGPLKSACIHYDRSGRSLGTADVMFERKADAVKAIKQYHGVPLDGRPMNIQFATTEVPLSARGRVSTRPRGAPVRRTSGGGSGGTRRGGPVKRGRVNTKGVPPTIEQLDAELDAYVNDMK